METRNISNDTAKSRKNKKRGRISKELKDKGCKGNHDKHTSDNSFNTVFVACKNSLDEAINIIFEVMNISPAPSKINILVKRDKRSYIEFCKKKIFDIYLKSYPKHLSVEPKKNKETGKVFQRNEAILQAAINIESKRKITNILEYLFNYCTFYSIFRAFLIDNKKNMY